MDFYQVDAFTEQAFKGNPAGVCLLDEPVDNRWMQDIAMEMNLSETAFLIRRANDYHLRWFTPVTEVDLCGHATLASAHVLYETGRVPLDQPIQFHTRSGLLTADRDGSLIILNFPAGRDRAVVTDQTIRNALGVDPEYTGTDGSDLLVELSDEQVVKGFVADLQLITELDYRVVIVTASSSGPFDFVSRVFAPAVGVDEDPVTGSAHCYLGPYWASKLGKTELIGYQASSRGGIVKVSVCKDRVILGGNAVTVLSGKLHT